MPLPVILQDIEEDFAVVFECSEDVWFEQIENGRFEEAWFELKKRSDKYIDHDYPV